MQENVTAQIDRAQLMFRNFEGRETEFNAPGSRNFCVPLDPNVAEVMRRDGWNIKTLKPREEGDEPRPYIQVAVGFKIRPPRLVMINSISRKRVVLDEETCELLDWADVMYADLIIRQRPWSIRGNSGVKAYLKTLYAIIDEDALDLRYSEDNQSALELTGGTSASIIDGQILERYELEAGE